MLLNAHLGLRKANVMLEFDAIEKGMVLSLPARGGTPARKVKVHHIGPEAAVLKNLETNRKGSMSRGQWAKYRLEAEVLDGPKYESKLDELIAKVDRLLRYFGADTPEEPEDPIEPYDV